MKREITIYDMVDLVDTTIKNLSASDVELSVSLSGVNELQAIVDGKKCIFTLTELMKQKNSIKGFVGLIQGKIR